MTTVGGNVKELCTASAAGDLATVRYHLRMGMDPNFQHPEFMTTPLIEAARSGQTEAVQLLLQHGAEPTITADFEGCTALEEAVLEGHHTVVDALLPYLAAYKDYEYECLVIWVHVSDASGPFSQQQQRFLVQHFLTKGHCVLWSTMDEEDEALSSSSSSQQKDNGTTSTHAIADMLRATTRNQKLFVMTSSPEQLADFFSTTPATMPPSKDDTQSSSSCWRPTAVDVCLRISNAKNDPSESAAEVESYYKSLKGSEWKVPFRGGGTPRVLLLHMGSSFGGVVFRSNTKEVVEQAAVQTFHSNSHNDIKNDVDAKEGYRRIIFQTMDPLTWWERLVYVLWSHEPWCDKVLDALTRLRQNQNQMIRNEPE